MEFTLNTLQAGKFGSLAVIQDQEGELVVALELQHIPDATMASCVVGAVYLGKNEFADQNVDLNNKSVPLREILILHALKRLVTSMRTGQISQKVHLTHPNRVLPVAMKNDAEFFVEEPTRLCPILDNALFAASAAFEGAGHSLRIYL